MFSLVKKVFTVLLSFSSSLVIDLNPVELRYYLFMISLDKCSDLHSTIMSYLQKYVFQKKTKDINVKVFNMITTKMKLEPWQNIFYVIGTQI